MPSQTSVLKPTAHEARKAAALAESYSPDDPAVQAKIQKEADDEAATISRLCKELNVAIHQVRLPLPLSQICSDIIALLQINPDGHCLFSAIADQLALLGLISPDKARYDVVRVAAANYIYTHADEFLPFLPSADGDADFSAGATGLMNPKQFEEYCKAIQNTAVWGGEPEILALSRVYNVPIHVIQADQPNIVVHDPTPDTPSNVAPARISYHRRMYGLGEVRILCLHWRQLLTFLLSTTTLCGHSLLHNGSLHLNVDTFLLQNEDCNGHSIRSHPTLLLKEKIVIPSSPMASSSHGLRRVCEITTKRAV